MATFSLKAELTELKHCCDLANLSFAEQLDLLIEVSKFEHDEMVIVLDFIVDELLELLRHLDSDDREQLKLLKKNLMALTSVIWRAVGGIREVR